MKGKAGVCDSSYSISIGPVHPALKEPVKFSMTIGGEQVTGVDVELSQVHRGIEWAGTKRNPIQILYLAERICGICNICHSLAFSKAVEAIAGIEVPERAGYIRTIMAELERIHSHILWAGVAAHELGFDSVMHYTWKLRENVLDTIEYLTGNRITKAIITIGGVRRDIKKTQFPTVEKTVDYYLQSFDRLAKIFLQDPVIKSRTRDTGILTNREALATCAVGPTARASGVRKDVRVDEPYAAYPDMDLDPMMPDMVTGEVMGDVYDRIITRLLEVKQSAEIIGRCLKQMPAGKIAYEEKAPKLLAELRGAEGEGIGRHEAPRGEVIHYVRMVADDHPYAWKVRAPTYNNLLAWVPMLMGEQIADIPIVAASTDPCMSCTNRVVKADMDTTMYTRDQLHRMSVDKTRKMKGVLND
jgi:membrane-bound hydrogenase subunit alpha